MWTYRRLTMSSIIRFTVVAAVFGFFLTSPTYAEITGHTLDIRYGLDVIGYGIFALAVGIAVAGIAIGYGLKMQKK